MSLHAAEPAAPRPSVLDVVERVAAANGWPFERRDDDEIAAEVPGEGAAYQLWFAWDGAHDALHFSCLFPLRVPEARRGLVYRLLALVNRRLWLGHFDYWPEDGMAAFRQTLPLRGAGALAAEQVEDMVGEAHTACERFYPAF